MNRQKDRKDERNTVPLGILGLQNQYPHQMNGTAGNFPRDYHALVRTTLLALCALNCFVRGEVGSIDASRESTSPSLVNNVTSATFLSLGSGALQEPDPIPAVRNLLSAQRPFRIVFTVHHHPTKTGMEREFVGQGNVHQSITFHSCDFEAKVRAGDFVMELLTGITNPFVSGRVFAGEARGFLSRSNLCWKAMAGQDVRLEEGHPAIEDGILAGSVPVGWSPRVHVSIWCNWMRAMLRAGIYEMEALSVVDSSGGIISLPTGDWKRISVKTQNGSICEIFVVEADGSSIHMVRLDEFRQWPFGRYPAVITRYWRLPGGTWTFGKKFVLHEFEWLEETMPDSAFLPKPEYLQQRGLLPVGVYLERSNEVYSLQGTNWLPVRKWRTNLHHAQIQPLGPDSQQKNTTGIRTAVLAALLASTAVFGFLAAWKISNARNQQARTWTP